MRLVGGLGKAARRLARRLSRPWGGGGQFLWALHAALHSQMVATHPAVAIALNECAGVLRELSGALAVQERVLASRSWRLYSQRAVQGHATDAFRWLKAMDPSAAVEVGCQRPDQLLARARKECREIWAAADKPPDGMSPRAGELQRMPPITPTDVLKAWRTVRPRTSVTAGIRPTFVVHAGEGLRVLIAAMLTASELVGAFPTGLRRVYVALLPKSSGGLRPIQLYATIVRAWHRTRREDVRAWRRRLHGRYQWVNTRQGADPLDVVWRDTVAAVTEAPRDVFTLCVLSDIGKCFEHVPWEGLFHASRAAGYPSAILRVPTSVYAAPRVLMLGRAVCAPLYPSRGIGPGSALATDELSLYLGPVSLAWAQRHPALSVSLHVDDIATSATGKRLPQALAELAKGFSELADELDTVGIPLSATKQQCVASHPRALRAMRSAFGKWAGKPVTVATKLGVDFGAGTCGVVHAYKATRRVKEALKRVRRATRLRAGRGARIRLAIPAIGAAASFGAIVTGIPPRDLGILASASVRAAGVAHYGADPYVVYAVVPELRPFTVELLAAPLLRYVGERWAAMSRDPSAGVLAPPSLVRAFEAGLARLDAARTWQCIRNSPAALAIYAARSVKWLFATPTTLVLPPPHGLLDVMGSSRPVLLSLFTTAFVRLAIGGQVSRLRRPGDAVQPRPLAPTCWAPPLARLLQRTKGPLAPRERHALAAVSAGTLFTGARLATWGLQGTRCGTCQLCGDAAGTLLHRMLHCPSPSASVWPSMPDWPRGMVREAGPDEVPLALSRLW